ncbi:MAG: cyclase family protein [Actinomycetota bacterium]|nr:cyclase family protein [Actinomycetota bacterium]HZY65400.1 cyclase family protein [Rubrobacteraceae bacterium]
MRVRDLSQTYANGMPHAKTIPEPHFEQVKSVERDGYSVTQLSVATHIDAPSHLIENGQTIEEVTLDTLVGPALAVSIDKGPGEEITAEDLDSAVSGGSPGDALLIRTGWGQKFGDEDYGNHPYLSEDAARWIVDRRFRLVGLDATTPDAPGHLRTEDFDFQVHRVLLGSGVLIVEHLHLEEVVGEKFELIIGALKVEGADGAPARVLALLESGEG